MYPTLNCHAHHVDLLKAKCTKSFSLQKKKKKPGEVVERLKDCLSAEVTIKDTLTNHFVQNPSLGSIYEYWYGDNCLKLKC